jgi:hypothetical protein
VGQASTLCTQTAVNPEIAALKQHQDPASPNAAAINKQSALDLAVQIKSVGGDPFDAIKSGTFAPGQMGDPTAKGNSCDDASDSVGCIFTQNLLVPDVTDNEICDAYVFLGLANEALLLMTGLQTFREVLPSRAPQLHPTRPQLRRPIRLKLPALR